MRVTGLLLGLIAVACFARGFWTIVHGGPVLQFVLLELSALILAGGGGWLWERGGK
jgi:hypothetical protein